MTKTDEKKNSSTTVRQESGRKEREETSNRARERAVIDVTGLPVANDEDSIKSAKSNSSFEEAEKEREHVSEESLDQRILQNVEYVMRKSHKDTLTKRHAKIATKASGSSSDSKTVSVIQNAPKMKKLREENDSRSLERNKVASISIA